MGGKRRGAPDGNQNARIVHGGAGAVRRIQEGKPFVGLAAQEEARVKADLESAGRSELVKEAAIRLHTAMRLYWNAVVAAADAGDLKKLDSYCARFGWLAGAALRAWREVREEGRADRLDLPGAIAHVIIEGEGRGEKGEGRGE